MRTMTTQECAQYLGVHVNTLRRWAQATDMPQVFASVLCGVDPAALVDFMNHFQTFMMAG